MSKIIYTDGSGSSNHLGGKAVAIEVGLDNTPIHIEYREYEKELTCNEAEYNAVLLAIEEQSHGEKIHIFSDSQLIVNQLSGNWNINYEHLELLNNFIKDIIANFELDVDYTWVPREKNVAGLYLEGKIKCPNVSPVTRR